MRFNIIRLAAAVALALGAPAAYASNAGAGYITAVGTNVYGTTYFFRTGTRTGSPNCQNASLPDRWNFDSTTAAGQAQLATIMTAYALH